MPPVPVRTDALIIGAGPVGLYMAFELALLEIQAVVVDALPYPGGQPETLYPDKPIYDLPGLPCISGRELTAALMQQVKPLNLAMHLGQAVQQLTPQHGDWLVSTRDESFVARTVFIAAGVGAFAPRHLKVSDGAAERDIGIYEGRQLFYHLHQAPPLKGQRVLVTGGEDEAVAAALHAVAQGAQKVWLLHRRDVFKAEPELLAALQAQRDAGAIEVVAGQPLHFKGDERLLSLDVLTPEGQQRTLEVDVVLPMLGLSPKLGPIADWNLAMSRKQLQVNTETFATNAPGIFAVGDINTYPGKKKLLVSGFHECVLAAFGAAAYLRPDTPALLQYTTTSSKLHQILGVAHPTKS